MADAGQLLIGRVDDLDEAVFKGNGKPGLVTRMAVCERRQDEMETRQDGWEKAAAERQQKWERIATKLLISAACSVLAIIAKIVVDAVHLHF